MALLDVLIFATLMTLVAAQSQLYLNYGAVQGDHVYHDFSDPSTVTLYLSLNAYPCSAASCAAGTCSHPYCATSGQLCTTGDETFSATIGPVAFTFACCASSDITSCGNPNVAAGFVTISSVSGTANYLGKAGHCAPLQSNAALVGNWDFTATIPVSTIKSQCNTASPRTGWIPIIAPQSVNQATGGIAHVQVQVSGNNNNVDPVWFNATVAIVTGSATPPAITSSTTYLNGPTDQGLYNTINCGAAAQISPPPACATTSSCSGSCGCAYISMLNRTYNANGCGTNCPTTQFWFQVCLLCQFQYSYLAICGGTQGKTALYSLGTGNGQMSGTYQGTLCSYNIQSGAHTNQGCAAIQWAQNGCNWASGNCDFFTITIAGDASDFTFAFNVHDGQQQTFQGINLNSGTCAYGSCLDGAVISSPNNFGTCPCPSVTPTTGPPSTFAPTTQPATTPAATTPAGTGPTTSPSATSTTISQTTTVTGTTAPSSTTAPPACPLGYCGAACDVCCYTGSGSFFQAYCVPNGAGSYAYTLVQHGDTVPTGAFQPGTTDSNGCQADCTCQLQTKACSCSATACICDTCTGQCSADASCVVTTHAPGQTCAACPTDSQGATCGGNGGCLCNGTCVCSTQPDASGALYSGPSCSTPFGPAVFTNCTDCQNNGYVWCDLAGTYVCGTNATCQNLQGIASNEGCDVSVIVPPECASNCSCAAVEHGQCTSSEGITQCFCYSGFHGGDCCSSGGLNVGAVAGGIAGGVIAAIVVAGVAACLVLTYGAKKGVDWVQLQNTAGANFHNNPMHVDRDFEAVNPIHT